MDQRKRADNAGFNDLGGNVVAISAYAQQQLLRMETQAKFPYFIEISHPDIGTAYMVNADEDKVFDGHTYGACFFSIQPPEHTESSIGNATLTISGVDGEWIQKIREQQNLFSCRFVAAIEYTDNGDEVFEAMEDNHFTLRGAQWVDQTITWTMEYDSNLSIKVPCDVATPQKCAGCN